MATSGPDFSMTDFLAGFGPTVRPSDARPLVVHDDELVPIPSGSVSNPTTLRIAGTLPTTTFELFRQTIGAGESSDMQRHYHETVHYVLAGEGHSEIEAADGGEPRVETVGWRAGSFVFTPPWAWHRHYNDSSEDPVEFLTIEASRLLGLLGLVRRESAGLATFDEARARFPLTTGGTMTSTATHPVGTPAATDLPEHVSVWAELADLDHSLRHVTVPVAGFEVRTRVLQAGEGPELVLLHGTGGHLEAYARDLAGLARDFHVTAYDMAGHGWSDLPDTPYTIDVLTEHLVALLDVLGIQRAHLSGESLGGWVVAWTAAHHPDRVDRLVLNTPGNIANKPEVMQRMRESTMAAVLDPSEETVRRRVEFLFHHKEMVTDELVNLRRQVYSRPGFVQAITHTLVLQDPEVRKDFAWDPAWVSRVAAPTLLLWTDHDPTGGLDEAEMLLDWLPDARLHVIRDAGHWPQWEKVEEFLDTHRRWLLHGEDPS